MCTNSQSDSDNASFTETRQKPIKPLPGLVPSHSRITAQKLINKHRESKRTELPEYSTDTNPNITDDEYDGDTEEYEVKPVPSPTPMTSKTEQKPEE